MRRSLPEPTLLVITDRHMARRPLRDVVVDVLAGGCRWIMLREKDLSREALRGLADELVARAAEYGAAVTINADAQVAADCGADGVHLPQGYAIADARSIVGSETLIGVSAHSREEARRAAADGADYVTLSPIFATPSKPGYGPTLGPDELARVADTLPIPVLALAGITPENVAACVTAGAAGVAVMGAVMRADRPRHVVERLLTEIQGGDADEPTH